jgi:DNA-binding CsgD family transcriptional regulator
VRDIRTLVDVPVAHTGPDAALRRVLDVARDEVAAGVLLVGPDGAGVTRLVVEAVRRLTAQGASTCRIRGRGPTAARPAVADLLADPVPPGSSGYAVLRQVLAVLVARSRTRPPVLVAHDAHLLDDVSMVLLLQAAERRLCFVICPVSLDAPAPERLVPLWKDGLFERIALAPAAHEPGEAHEPDAAVRQAWTLPLQGRLLEAERVARAAYRRASAQGHTETAGAFATTICQHLLLRGRPVSAGRWAATALHLLDGDGEWQAVARAGCAIAAALTGAPPWPDGVPAGAGGPATAGGPAERLPGPGRSATARARAWTAVARGETATAELTLSAAAAEAREWRDPLWELLLQHDQVRLGRPERAAGPLSTLAAAVGGRLAPAMADHAHALTGPDAAALATAATALAAAGADLLAAEAAAQAADAYRGGGDGRGTTVAAARSQLWASRCQGARTPALTDGAVVLSPRELQIARLAATSATSRALAARLGVSARTVDNHLRRCYAKLGLAAGRAELRELLGYEPTRPAGARWVG